jgi:sugar O-acyltransferase (sialic acid O-acetyltransferase NeuD family)
MTDAQPSAAPSRQPIVFWGATGQAKVLRECVAASGYDLVALFDNNPDVPPPFTDVPLHVGRAGLVAWQRTHWGPTSFLVAIGGSLGRDRLEIQALLCAAGLIPVTAIHRTAFVAGNALIGPGSQILAQAAVCVEVCLGTACIVNTGASVDHECVLGDGVHVAPGARLAGSVAVGRHSMIGIGATVLPRVRIGENVIIGAGAVVTRNVPDNVIVTGMPAKIVKERPIQ